MSISGGHLLVQNASAIGDLIRKQDPNINSNQSHNSYQEPKPSIPPRKLLPSLQLHMPRQHSGEGPGSSQRHTWH